MTIPTKDAIVIRIQGIYPDNTGKPEEKLRPCLGFPTSEQKTYLWIPTTTEIESVVPEYSVNITPFEYPQYFQSNRNIAKIPSAATTKNYITGQDAYFIGTVMDTIGIILRDDGTPYKIEKDRGLMPINEVQRLYANAPDEVKKVISNNTI